MVCSLSGNIQMFGIPAAGGETMTSSESESEGDARTHTHVTDSALRCDWRRLVKNQKPYHVCWKCWVIFVRKWDDLILKSAQKGTPPHQQHALCFQMLQAEKGVIFTCCQSWSSMGKHAYWTCLLPIISGLNCSFFSVKLKVRCKVFFCLFICCAKLRKQCISIF